MEPFIREGQRVCPSLSDVKRTSGPRVKLGTGSVVPTVGLWVWKQLDDTGPHGYYELETRITL